MTKKFFPDYILAVTGSFLLIFVAVSFLFSPSFVTLGETLNTVEVTAQIQPSQVLKVEGKNNAEARTEVLFPVNFGHADKISENIIQISKTFTLNLGSNIEWRLFARVENFEETKSVVKNSGWKVETFKVTGERVRTELDESPRKIASGSYGMHNLEVSFEIILSRANSSHNDTPPLGDLENVLIFSLK
ncbi:MAG: hypothetical protein ACOC6I_02020 [Candidatus Bipolaricaulota bacterium]